MEEYKSDLAISEIQNTKNDDLKSNELNLSVSLEEKLNDEDDKAFTKEQLSTTPSLNDKELGFSDIPTPIAVPSQWHDGSMPSSSNANLEINVSKENSETEHIIQGEAGLFVKQKSIDPQSVYPESFKRQKLELYGKVTGPCFYTVDSEMVSQPLIAKNLPAAFEGLPLAGKPEGNENMKDFQNKKLKEFIESDLPNSDFENLSKYCSIDHLKTGYEIIMPSKIPSLGVCPPVQNIQPGGDPSGDLLVNRKYKIREDVEDVRYLKYRGVRVIEPPKEDDEKASETEEMLVPGKDLIYRVRIYRPFPSTSYKNTRVRHSLCQFDVVLLGRQPLWALRDRIVCTNDTDMRLDVSDNPDVQPTSTAREVFPSGFFFINNVLYSDTRPGRRDLTAELRQWARDRKLGDFPCLDMDRLLHDVHLRLGHPEVYVHQGNCEHLFTFSSVRVATALDPLRISSYPYNTILTSNQTVYCTTCAEFGAKWVVTGSKRVPFDPAFFCDTCLKLYMYKDGKKIGDFKAFSYRGNEINLLKPMTDNI